MYNELINCNLSFLDIIYFGKKTDSAIVNVSNLRFYLVTSYRKKYYTSIEISTNHYSFQMIFLIN